jgi:hypothetical protein
VVLLHVGREEPALFQDVLADGQVEVIASVGDAAGRAERMDGGDDLVRLRLAHVDECSFALEQISRELLLGRRGARAEQRDDAERPTLLHQPVPQRLHSVVPLCLSVMSRVY